MKSKLGILKKRFGFLPLWAWLTLAGAVVYAWRKRAGGSTSTSTDVGAAAATGNGTIDTSSGGFGAGDGGGGLPLDTPSAQPTADPTLLHAGAAAVCDPLGSNPNATGTGNGANLSGSTDAKGDVGPDAPATRHRRAGAEPVATDFPTVGRHVTHPASTTTPPRPRSSTGTKSANPRTRKAPELISEHGKGQMVAHPASRSSAPRTAPAPQLVSERGASRPVEAVTRSRTTGAGAAATKPAAAAPKPKPTPPATQVRRPGAQR